MLRLFHSNNSAWLAHQWVLSLAQHPLKNMFEPEIIWSADSSQTHFFQHTHTRTVGITANWIVESPYQGIWQLLSKALPDVPPTNPFSEEVLTLRLLQFLVDLENPDLAEQSWVKQSVQLIHYLGQHHAQDRVALAKTIASCFVRYLTLRPLWLEQWAKGESVDQLAEAVDQSWQCAFWYWLGASVALVKTDHPYHRLKQRVTRGLHPTQKLPERISIIGVSALPWIYWEILALLGAWINIDIYFYNPCANEWGEVSTHPLLKSLGRERRQTLEHFAQLISAAKMQDFAYYPTTVKDNTLLHRLQSSFEGEVMQTDIADQSISIHGAHSYLRQFEVLEQWLLQRFHEDKSLGMGDVLVLVNDIQQTENALPLAWKTLPYQLIGNQQAGSSQRQLWQNLLQLLTSRFSVNDVFDVLSHQSLHMQWKIDTEALAPMNTLLQSCGVRWGIDTTHAKKFFPEATPAFRWSEGLSTLLFERMLGGDVMPGAYQIPDIAHLAKLLRCLAALEQLQQDCQTHCTLKAWHQWLIRLRQGWIADDDNNAVLSIDKQINQLYQAGQIAVFEQPITFVTLRALLDQCSDEARHSARPNARVSVARLTQFRAQPYRIIALVGLDSGTFPRQPQYPRFDLIAQYPHASDHHLRDTDLGAFLDVLTAAQSHLFLSYQARDLQKNTALAPCAALSLLSSYIDQTLCPNTAKLAYLEHKLTPLSEALSSRNSYDAAIVETIHNLSEQRQVLTLPQISSWVQKLQRTNSEPRTTLSTQAVATRWADPLFAYLSHDLRMALFPERQQAQDLEPIAPSKRLKQHIQQAMLQGKTMPPTPGEWPDASVGVYWKQQLSVQVQIMLSRLPLLTAPSDRSEFISVACGKFTVNATLGQWFGDDRVLFFSRKPQWKDLLQIWLEHLFAHHHQLEVKRTLGVFEDEIWLCQHPFIDNTPAIINRLAEELERPPEQNLAYFGPKSAQALFTHLWGKTAPNQADQIEWTQTLYNKVAEAWHSTWSYSDDVDAARSLLFAGTEGNPLNAAALQALARRFELLAAFPLTLHERDHG